MKVRILLPASLLLCFFLSACDYFNPFMNLAALTHGRHYDEGIITRHLPPEMTFEGEPLDPVCVYNAYQDKSAALEKHCTSLAWGETDEGTAVTRSKLKIDPNAPTVYEMVGYEYDFGNETSGRLSYLYLGKTAEGLAIELNYSGGGSGSLSNLSIYKRKGNTLHKVKHVAGGDRCSGLHEASVVDGDLIYSYYVSTRGLYRHYRPDSRLTKDLDNSPIRCSAVIHMRNDRTEKVELEDSAVFPECFEETYKQQIKSGKILSDEKARNLIQELSNKCPAE